MTGTRARPPLRRWLAALRSCLSTAWRQDLITNNPALKVQPFQRAPGADESVGRPGASTAGQGHRQAAHGGPGCLRLLLCTGCRVSELMHAHWEDIDTEARVWHLPRPKSGRAQTVMLTTEAVELLKELPRGDRGSSPVAGSGGGTTCASSGCGSRGCRHPDVTLHDLRRTVSTRLIKSYGLATASAVMRHSSPAITARHYMSLGNDELREALEGIQPGAKPKRRKALEVTPPKRKKRR